MLEKSKEVVIKAINNKIKELGYLEDINLNDKGISEKLVDTDMVLIFIDSEKALDISKKIKEKGILTLGIIEENFINSGNRSTILESTNSFFIKRNSDKNISEKLNGLINLITKVGLINLDFDDIKKILEESSEISLGYGESNCEDKYNLASNLSIKDLDPNLTPSTIILNITANSKIGLQPVFDISNFFKEKFPLGEKLLFAVTTDDTLGEMIEICVLVK